MTRRKLWSGFVLLFFLFAVPASEASMLSQQYTSRWAPSDFFPLETTAFRIGTVENETGHGASFDMLGYLTEQTRQQLTKSGFKDDGSGNPGAVVVDLRVHLYQEGSTFGRWLGGGAGAAYAVVHATFRKPGQPVGAELLTVSVIGGGGLFSAGSEKTVLEDAAHEIASFMKGEDKK
jgi:hypothetical protein